MGFLANYFLANIFCTTKFIYGSCGFPLKFSSFLYPLPVLIDDYIIYFIDQIILTIVIYAFIKLIFKNKKNNHDLSRN